MWTLGAVLIGFIIDLLVGDPHGFPHPVILIGKLISALESLLRRKFQPTVKGERLAGLVLWIVVCAVSAAVPALLLWGLRAVSPWLSLAAESIMCWQILALRSLRTESMKVYHALKSGSLKRARYAVSMIVGRDTETLDEAGITRAAVETVAENTSDGVIAPLLFMMVLGAPFGFLYKAVNTMDSMLGYTDPPYRNIGLVPAKADDVFNFIPARLSALLMLLSGKLLNVLDARRDGGRIDGDGRIDDGGRRDGDVRIDGGGRRDDDGRIDDGGQRDDDVRIDDGGQRDDDGWKGYNIRNGWYIFRRDRYHHASPNSAQTESVCAGSLGVQLAGDAWYHGVLHKKPYIGDPLREIEHEDIPRTCRLMYGTAIAALVIFGLIRLLCCIRSVL